jgi:energy-coupling factor transporter ATP-binding protein EcfA2
VLELRDLARRYGETVALDGVSITVGAGQMYGFVGPNSAGKTTAMRIVLGGLAPDRGEVASTAGSSTSTPVPGSATCRRSVGCTQDAGARPARLPGAAPRDGGDRRRARGRPLVTLGGAALLIPLAARIYAGGILRTGSALKLRDAWRAARA